MGCCKGCDDKPQLSGHPHTVRAPITPLYQLGWLGDDDIPDVDPSTGLPWGSAPPIDPGISPDTPTVDASGMPLNPLHVFGPPGPGQPGSAVTPNPVVAGTYAGAPSFLQSLANMFKTPAASGSNLPLGPSPRVGTAFPSTISMGSALPLLAVVGIGIVVISSIGGRRR